MALAVVIGLILRLLPALLDPGIQFLGDSAYHARLIQVTTDSGRLPSIDPLSEAPGGRPTAKLLPTGLYQVAAAFSRCWHAAHLPDAPGPLEFFTALMGALVALPVFLATLAVFGDPRAAAWSALVASILPAHVAKTAGFWLRYDALGTFLITLHVAFAFRALRPTGRRSADAEAGAPKWRGFLDPALSGLCLLAAVWSWRVALIVPLAEALYVAAWTSVRGVERPLRLWFTALTLIGTVGLPAIEYLRAQHFVLSAAWLFGLGLAGAMWLPVWRGSVARGVVVVLVGLAAWAVGSVTGPLREYDAVFAMVEAKLSGLLHLSHSLDPRSALMLDVEELQGTSLLNLLFASHKFFLLGTLFVLAPFLVWAYAPKRGPRFVESPSGAGLLAAFSAVLWVQALLLERGSVLLAPFVAMVTGGLLALAWPSAPIPAPAPPAGRKRERPATERRAGGAPTWLRATLAVAIGGTAVCGVLMAATRHARLDPMLDEALGYLQRETPSGAVVVGFWDYGYEIQAHAGHPTVVDGLLESPVNRDRILEYEAAFMKDGTAPLLALCRRDRASYVMVPRRAAMFYAMARRQDPALARHLMTGEPLTDQDLSHGLVRLLTDPAHVAPFSPVFENHGFRIFRILAPAGETG